MRPTFLRRLWLAALFISLPSFADPVTSGWSVGLSCPPKGATGAGSLVASNAAGFGGAGSCHRLPGLFSRLTFSTHGGGTLRSSSAISLQTPSVLITPPLLTTESQPIFSVANTCPVAPGTTNLNWLFVQWTDAERRALTNTYLFGTATYSSAAGVHITGQYDVDGTPYSLASHPMPGACTNGVYPVSGSIYGDINGSIYFNAAGMGAFKTQAGRATFFFPRFTITAATHFGSKAYRGLSFDADGANGAGDVRHVKATADAAGTTFTVQALSDPENATVDVSGTAYTDTVTFAGGNINSPQPGMLFGTVTRTGYRPGTSDVACIANASDGDVLLLCSGESPSDNTLPFHFSLYAEKKHNNALGPDGDVYALSLDTATGKAYIGGRFLTVDGMARTRVARLNADGTLDTAFDPGTGFDNHVLALAFEPSSGKVYAAGYFTTFNGSGATRIARLNADGTFDSAFNVGAGFNGNVWALSLDTATGKLYVGGQFTEFDGTPSNGIARLNADGTLDTGFVTGTGFNGSVLSLAPNTATGKLYAAGFFSAYDGTARVCIARLNADGSIDTAFVPDIVNSAIYAVALDASGKPYIGGSFTNRNRIARMNLDGTIDTGFDPGTGFNNTVQALAFDGTSGALYAGGSFYDFNGTPRYSIARLDASGSVDTGFNPSAGLGAAVWNLTVDAAGKVYAGGANLYLALGRTGVARLNADGSVDGAFIPSSGFGSTVSALFLDEPSGKLYAGGSFKGYGDTSRNGVARLNSDGTLDSSFDPGAGFNDSARSLALDSVSGKLYVGGNFTTFDGTGINRIARLNGNGTLDSTFDPGSGFNDYVFAVVRDDLSGKLYVGGNFTTFNGGAMNRIARLNSDGTLDSTFNVGSGFDGSVTALALDATSGTLYAAGSFVDYNGTARNRIIRLSPDGSVDTAFNPGTGFDSFVSSLALDAVSGKLYVGGNFSDFDGTGRSRIARLNANGTLDTAFDPGTGANGTVTVFAFERASGTIYVGGEFSTFNGVGKNRLVRLKADGSFDSTFDTGSGFNHNVYAIAPDPLSGKVTVGSAATGYGSSTIGFIARLTYNGALD